MHPKFSTFMVMIGVAAVVLFAAVEVNKIEKKAPPTPVDLFRESYIAHMRRSGGSGLAEMRAEDALKLQVCDRNHVCAPLVKKVEEKEMVLKLNGNLNKFCKFENVGSYTHICAW